MDLIIVESPTKARTIAKFLGDKYEVVSSYGHVRDLPKFRMGIDIENNFQPHYVIPKKAKPVVASLKEKAKKADQVILAPDEDREGEAIAWHLSQVLKLPSSEIKRIVFHEVTAPALKEALKNPRGLNFHLVDAQQARRVLDRLVGYELSPFLWRKVAKGLSAGRVQSVAVRFLVEREEERQKFEKQEYWTLEADFFFAGEKKLRAKLEKLKGKKLEKFSLKNKKQVEEIVAASQKEKFFILNKEEKETRRQPKPPFITSTLQQEANNKFGFSSKKTMMLAQQLYEGIKLGKEAQGLITYMRTDSFNLSPEFCQQAKDYLTKELGAEFVYEGKRSFSSRKQKFSQEAHEAIRPTNVFFAPSQIKEFLSADQFKLYDLIWRRALATQMPDAILKTEKIILSDKEEKFSFLATGFVIQKKGFLEIYPEQLEEKVLPSLALREEAKSQKFYPQQHFTEPPARYTDASLVKQLEKYGIGRPSTYAPTINTILQRGYVKREGRYLIPQEIAFVVVKLLKEHFPQIIDYQFTARIEEQLDKIAQGELAWQPIINNFYRPFKENLENKKKEIKKEDLGLEKETKEKCPLCAAPLVIKLGRFGKFYACRNFPECKYTRPLEGEKKEPLETKEVCEKCGRPMVIKEGRFGKFLACSGYPECKNIKPLNKGTGVKCPQCQQGEIVEKRTRRGRVFYACSRYPQCKFALWQKPTGNICPQCGSLMVWGKGKKEVCSNKDCPNSRV